MFDRKITPQCEFSIFFQQMLISVSAFHTFFTESIFGPVHIGGCMCGLYRWYDLILSKLIKICRRYNLGVLDSPSTIAIIMEVFAINIQYNTIGRIAYRMGICLKLTFGNLFDHCFVFLRAMEEKAVGGCIMVMRKEACTTGSQCAIGEQFKSFDLETVCFIETLIDK
ncbi:hypothetical protein D3C73_594880 [compost metagenome]